MPELVITPSQLVLYLTSSHPLIPMSSFQILHFLGKHILFNLTGALRKSPKITHATPPIDKDSITSLVLLVSYKNVNKHFVFFLTIFGLKRELHPAFCRSRITAREIIFYFLGTVGLEQIFSSRTQEF